MLGFNRFTCYLLFAVTPKFSVELLSGSEQSEKMLSTWLTAIQETAHRLSPFVLEGAVVWAYAGVALASLLVFGKIFAKLLCDSKRGLLGVFLGSLTPLVGAVIALAAARIYLFSTADLSTISNLFLYGVAGTGAFLSFLLLAHWFLGLGIFKSLFNLAITYAVTLGVLWLVKANEAQLPWFAENPLQSVEQVGDEPAKG